jgi:hypothetical protein
MHVIALHDIRDPEKFGELVGPTIEKIPSGMKLNFMLPSQDGDQAVCFWEAGSVEDVRSFIDGATGDASKNEYFPVEESQAIGLPQTISAAA